MPIPFAPSVPVRLLLVATPGARAQQIIGWLSGSVIQMSTLVVSQVSNLEQTLRTSTHDVVVCDFDSPAVCGLVALRIVRATEQDLPFIFVSSAPDIGAAVAAIKAGANDYLQDSDLVHLAPSVRHEVTRARERAQRRLAQNQVRATLARMELH